MLGERIAELRKNKGTTQEELADVLLTSRQAISKWERGESDPDIGRLKDLAVYFNVSIDYLLGYDLESTSVNNCIERLKKCSETGEYDITLDEIKTVVSRNSNNFNLILAAIVYISDYYFVKRIDGTLDLLIQYIKKAILLYQPGYEGITLNDLHYAVAITYYLKGEYELAKQYLKDNQAIRSEELLAQCDLALGHYDKIEKNASGIFLSSIGSLINTSTIQIRAYLRTNRVKDALDLSDWCINLVKSVEKKEEVFLDIIFMLTFIKAFCEKTLGLDYSKSLEFLKENHSKTNGFSNISDGFKFYNTQHIVFTCESGDIKSDLLKEYEELKKNGAKVYQDAFEIFNEVYGE